MARKSAYRERYSGPYHPSLPIPPATEIDRFVPILTRPIPVPWVGHLNHGQERGLPPSESAACQTGCENLQARVHSCSKRSFAPQMHLTRWHYLASVSYTHLTLPTNREV